MIDTANFAFPKPGHAAGRVVLSGAAYTRFKREKLRQQGGRCALCPRTIYEPGEAQLHHGSRISFTAAGGMSHGRGMNGGKRDDRESQVVCIECHVKEEGKKSVGKEDQAGESQADVG